MAWTSQFGLGKGIQTSYVPVIRTNYKVQTRPSWMVNFRNRYGSLSASLFDQYLVNYRVIVSAFKPIKLAWTGLKVDLSLCSSVHLMKTKVSLLCSLHPIADQWYHGCRTIRTRPINFSTQWFSVVPVHLSWPSPNWEWKVLNCHGHWCVQCMSWNITTLNEDPIRIRFVTDTSLTAHFCLGHSAGSSRSFFWLNVHLNDQSQLHTRYRH